jgi:hypothetical protein
MPTFEQRYLNGQCVEVWNDLIALGDKVRDKSILPDAQAVADETMRRARQNLEMLIPRLAEVGYRFAAPALERQLARIEKTLANPQLAPYVRRRLERAVREGRADVSVLNPAENKAVQLGLRRNEKRKQPCWRNLKGCVRCRRSKILECSTHPKTKPRTPRIKLKRS